MKKFLYFSLIIIVVISAFSFISEYRNEYKDTPDTHKEAIKITDSEKETLHQIINQQRDFILQQNEEINKYQQQIKTLEEKNNGQPDIKNKQ